MDVSGHAQSSPKPTEHFDVLIVGAGISGVGGAYHLTHQCPDKHFTLARGHVRYSGCCGRFWGVDIGRK